MRGHRPASYSRHRQPFSMLEAFRGQQPGCIPINNSVSERTFHALIVSDRFEIAIIREWLRELMTSPTDSWRLRPRKGSPPYPHGIMLRDRYFDGIQSSYIQGISNSQSLTVMSKPMKTSANTECQVSPLRARAGRWSAGTLAGRTSTSVEVAKSRRHAAPIGVGAHGHRTTCCGHHDIARQSLFQHAC